MEPRGRFLPFWDFCPLIATMWIYPKIKVGVVVSIAPFPWGTVPKKKDSDMADFFKFTWRCIKHAWRGCWTKANELASVLGGAILFAILFFLRNWLRTMNLINAPTTLWGTAGFAVALAIASVILAFLVIFLGRLVLAPTRLYWEQHRRADSLETDLLAMKANQDDGPNWSIHELFTLADPNFLSRTDEGVGDRWDEVGNDIRDQAALGRLRIWGRTMPRGVDSVLGQRTTLH